MNKEKVQLAVIGIGIVIFIALAAGNLKKRPARELARGALPLSGRAASQPAEMDARLLRDMPARAADEKDLALQKEREKLGWGRDPFGASNGARDYQKAALSLRGISLGKNKDGFAFINSEIVKIGDRIGEYEVTEIQRNRVMLRKGEQSFYLTLPQE